MIDNLKNKKILIYIIAVLVTTSLSIAVYITAFNNPLLKMELSFVWPEYNGKLSIEDSQMLKDFINNFNNSDTINGQLRDEDNYYKLKLNYKKNNLVLYMSKDLLIYNQEENQLIYSPSLKSFLAEQIYVLEKAFFGEIKKWNEIANMLPRRTGVAEIRDLETGYTFTIKRFGGLTHADIEPLDDEDTAILKKIYGIWSWKRRAAVATIEEKQYAASINGMPHGGGAIWDNEFRGHFCLHFLGSKVHASGKVDPGHQLMIYKAGGKLPELLDNASPSELVSYILAAVISEDILPLRYSSLGINTELWEELKEGLRHLQVNHLLERVEDESRAYVNADVTVYYEKSGEYLKKNLTIAFEQDEIRNSWRFDFNSLKDLL